MKISINWLLDHIETPITTIDVGLIAAKFNIHTAEIEHYEGFNLDSAHLFLVRVISIDAQGISVRCDELNTTLQLPFRNDLQPGHCAFVRRYHQDFAWEVLAQYSAAKEGLFPAVDCHESLLAGGWRQHCEESDYILDVDNKSINHRPDLWGHRGIAREVAAFMGWQVKPLDQMLAQIHQVTGEHNVAAAQDHTITVAIEDSSVCPRLAALHCFNITHKPSQIWMAMRLARVDSKPINTIVDITNYVMFDISQPMHVFDAAKFPDKTIVARKAHTDETLELLDGRHIQLTEQDIVITDGHKPVGLAGVMGGKQGSFSATASSIIIESGSFQASVVRNSATRYKVSSEASIRFSKQLDPMQNSTALLRFVYIAQGLGVIGDCTEKMVSVGKIIEPSVIVVSHAFIENRLGTAIPSSTIIAILHTLDFGVTADEQADDIVYHVMIPTLRMTKDITIPEDIVEEVVRMYGFANIAYQRPTRAMKSFDISPVMRLRKMKEHCAFALRMKEVRDYLFYDESFLQRLGWYPTNAVAVKNPVSENWKVLVTSLIPHLLKNVALNHHAHEQINFFECNNTWRTTVDHGSEETKAFSGIFFGHKNMNFYEYKDQLQGFFAALDIPVIWSKSSGELEPWFDPLHVADIMLHGLRIGRAGMLSTSLVRHLVQGEGFVFELQADAIIHNKPVEKIFTPWSKYQTVCVDISLLIDALIPSSKLEDLIVQVDTKIHNVTLVDFFEKPEWEGKRSLTFRYSISDYHHPVTKEIIDDITNKVVETMKHTGALVR